MVKTEYFDIYNGTGKPLGISKPKNEVHKKGLWHKSFHCWVIYRDENGTDRIVLQQRAPIKKTWPNKLDITAAGHYSAGEGIEGGLREIKEEIGLDVEVSDLLPLGIRVCIEEFDPRFINHEFQDVFFLINETPISSYKLQVEEVSGILSIKVDDALKLFTKQIKGFNTDGFVLAIVDGELLFQKKEFIVRESDFIPTLDNYNYKMMILAKRALASEKHLII